VRKWKECNVCEDWRKCGRSRVKHRQNGIMQRCMNAEMGKGIMMSERMRERERERERDKTVKGL
jgi:hypothetical protein